MAVGISSDTNQPYIATHGDVSMTSLANSVVFVTGASGGLGMQWVEQSIDRGAAKVYAADIAPRDWESDRVVPVELDVTDQASIDRAAALAGDTTILINNAGISLRDPITKVAAAALRRAFEIDFFGGVFMAQRFAPILARHGGGAIVNVVSAMSWIAWSGGYSAAKAAFWSATNSMRLELLPQKTHVLALHMGYVDTPMTVNISQPKVAADAVIRLALDGLEAGEYEVIGDDITRQIRVNLGKSLTELYPELL
jgi:NAD(P)-dependent dehydrogenase (short-subunit alcohol dehydrogenase family)